MTSIIFCCANSWKIFIFPSELITEASGVAEGSSWNRKAMKKAPRVDSLECRRKKFWQKKNGIFSLTKSRICVCNAKGIPIIA